MSYADYPQILQNIEHFGGKTNIVEHNTNEEELKKQAEEIEDKKLLILEGRGYADYGDGNVLDEKTDRLNFLIDTEMSEEDFKEELGDKLVVSNDNKYVLKMDDHPAYDFYIKSIEHNQSHLKHTYLTISLTPKSIKDGYKAANGKSISTRMDLHKNHVHIYPGNVNKSALDYIRVSPNLMIIVYIVLGIIGVPILILLGIVIYSEIRDYMTKRSRDKIRFPAQLNSSRQEVSSRQDRSVISVDDFDRQGIGAQTSQSQNMDVDTQLSSSNNIF